MKTTNYDQVIKELRYDLENLIEKEKICGVAIALVDEDRVIWSEGFGYTDYITKEKITADTLFSTQSMGKTIT
ncbi:MAG: beta-lactamase family protein, partial [Asgard group archaeon]|nr:beta-lactamase family protein [Asgard group archaeon]